MSKYYELEYLIDDVKEEHNYLSETKKEVIDGVKGNYPQLCTYESEWIYFDETGYIPGEPVEIEYQMVEGTNCIVENAIPHNYKSAILMGKTVNNLWSKLVSSVVVQKKTDDTIIENYSEQYYRITFGETQVNAATTIDVETTQQLQANKTYYINTFIFDGFYGTDSFLIRDISNNINLETLTIEDYPTGQIISFTTNGETNRLKFYYFAYSRKNGAINYGKPFYMPKRFIISDKLEDVVNQDFFEGMQSVKMPVLKSTGKNLFDVNGEKELSCFYNARLNGERKEHNDVDTYTIKIKPNTEYFLTCEGRPSMSHITYWDENLSYIGGEPTCSDNIIKQITSPQGAKYMRLPIHKEGVLNIQIEEGSVATPYEPFKSNILTVNEEVILRSNGDVYDELNLLTGRLTQRIDENNEILSQEVVKTVDLTPISTPFEGYNKFTTSSDTIPPIMLLEVPVISTGEQTLQDINK